MIKRQLTLFIFTLLFPLAVFTSCDISQSPHKNISSGGLRALGAKFDTNARQAGITVYKSYSTSSLPVSNDLISGYLPPVGDQGDQGSCVGWAIGYNMKTAKENMNNSWNNPAPGYLPPWENPKINPADGEFSPSWVYNQINGGVDGGSYPEDAMQLIVDYGIDTLADFPYNQNDYLTQPDSASMSRALQYKESGWEAVSIDINTIKQLLAAGKPVVIGIEIYTPDFDAISPSNSVTGDIYRSTNAYHNAAVIMQGTVYSNFSSTNRGGHAVCLTGYDDNLGAFRFVNQWTTLFGDNGFGWISYGFFNGSTNGVVQDAVTFD